MTSYKFLGSVNGKAPKHNAWGLKLQNTASSFIRTIPSAPESHRLSVINTVAGYTAGGEFHPAPKTTSYNIIYFYVCLSSE